MHDIHVSLISHSLQNHLQTMPEIISRGAQRTRPFRAIVSFAPQHFAVTISQRHIGNGAQETREKRGSSEKVNVYEA